MSSSQPPNPTPEGQPPFGGQPQLPQQPQYPQQQQFPQQAFPQQGHPQQQYPQHQFPQQGQPQFGQNPYGPPGQMPGQKKKTPLWVWIAGGIGALLLIGVVGAGIVGYMLYNKAKTVAGDFSTNPVAAVAKLAVAANPDYEYISTDEATGMIKVRQKKDGSTVEVSLEDLKEGRISIKTNDGQKMEIGANVDVKAPSWVPIVPDATTTGIASANMGDTEGGSIVLTTSMPAADLKTFYTDALTKGGFSIESSSLATSNDQMEGMVVAKKDAAGQTVSVMFATGEVDGAKKTTATIIFSEKKPGATNN